MQERPNVFISATTADLGSYRLAVRDTLLDQGVHPILQDHLEPDYQTLLDILRREINACDAVICLVGYVYGQEPNNHPARSSTLVGYPAGARTSPRRSEPAAVAFSLERTDGIPLTALTQRRGRRRGNGSPRH